MHAHRQVKKNLAVVTNIAWPLRRNGPSARLFANISLTCLSQCKRSLIHRRPRITANIAAARDRLTVT